MCIIHTPLCPVSSHSILVCVVVRVGVTQPHYLSSRLSLLDSHEHLKVKQVALYQQDSSSLLYSAMLDSPHARKKDRARLSSSTQSSGSEEVDGRLVVNSGDEEWVYIPLNEEDVPVSSQQEGTSDQRQGRNVSGVVVMHTSMVVPSPPPPPRATPGHRVGIVLVVVAPGVRHWLAL